MRTWSIVTLGDVTANGSEGLRRGPFGGAIKKDSFAPNGYKIYEQKHAIYADFEAGTYFIQEHHYKLLQSFSVRPGDLIVSCSGTLGRVAIVPASAKPGIINQALLRIRPKTDVVSSNFFKMLLETPELQSLLFGGAGGSAIKNVRPLSEIRKVQFKLPPMTEQQRIMDILGRAETLRAKRRSAFDQLDMLAQCIFFDLFGDPATNPRRWPETTLGEGADQITDGEHLTPERTNSGVKLLSARNIRDGYLDFADVDYVSVEEHERLKRRCNPTLGDVLVSCSGTIGRVSSVETVEPFSLVRSVALIRPKKTSLNSKFLENYLRTPALKARMLQRANASSQANLFQNQIRDLPLFLPPIKLQSEFNHRVVAVDRLKTAYRASLAEMDALFVSLQHRAFRGEL